MKSESLSTAMNSKLSAANRNPDVSIFRLEIENLQQ
jgi:hypothetical protein